MSLQNIMLNNDSLIVDREELQKLHSSIIEDIDRAYEFYFNTTDEETREAFMQFISLNIRRAWKIAARL